MRNRILEVVITRVIVLGFWNLLDHIIDDFITHEGFTFSVYYNILLPIIVGLAVELFPKKDKGGSSNASAKSEKSKKNKR